MAFFKNDNNYKLCVKSVMSIISFELMALCAKLLGAVSLCAEYYA